MPKSLVNTVRCAGHGPAASRYSLMSRYAIVDAMRYLSGSANSKLHPPCRTATDACFNASDFFQECVGNVLLFLRQFARFGPGNSPRCLASNDRIWLCKCQDFFTFRAACGDPWDREMTAPSSLPQAPLPRAARARGHVRRKRSGPAQDTLPAGSSTQPLSLFSR